MQTSIGQIADLTLYGFNPGKDPSPAFLGLRISRRSCCQVSDGNLETLAKSACFHKIMWLIIWATTEVAASLYKHNGAANAESDGY